MKFVIYITTLMIIICNTFCEDEIITDESDPQHIALFLASVPAYQIFNPFGVNTYSFGYQIIDLEKNNFQFREEEKLANGTIRGSYGHLRPDGRWSLTVYTADVTGYRPQTNVFKYPKWRPENAPPIRPPTILSDKLRSENKLFLPVLNTFFPVVISSLPAYRIKKSVELPARQVSSSSVFNGNRFGDP